MFNLDMSNHGGVAFSKAERSPSARREGQALAGFVTPVTAFDAKVRTQQAPAVLSYGSHIELD